MLYNITDKILTIIGEDNKVCITVDCTAFLDEPCFDYHAHSQTLVAAGKTQADGGNSALYLYNHATELFDLLCDGYAETVKIFPDGSACVYYDGKGCSVLKFDTGERSSWHLHRFRYGAAEISITPTGSHIVLNIWKADNKILCVWDTISDVKKVHKHSYLQYCLVGCQNILFESNRGLKILGIDHSSTSKFIYSHMDIRKIKNKNISPELHDFINMPYGAKNISLRFGTIACRGSIIYLHCIFHVMISNADSERHVINYHNIVETDLQLSYIKEHIFHRRAFTLSGEYSSKSYSENGVEEAGTEFSDVCLFMDKGLIVLTSTGPLIVASGHIKEGYLPLPIPSDPHYHTHFSGHWLVKAAT